MTPGLGALGEAWAGWILAALIGGSALAALTAVVAAPISRRWPALAAALWLVALVKFCLPVAPEVPVALEAAWRSALPGEAPAGAAAAAAVAPERGGALPGLLVGLAALHLAVVGGAGVRRIRRYRRALAHAAALPAPGPALLTALGAAAARAGVPAPRARQAREGRAPYLVGLVRPTLVVPSWLADRPELLAAALDHELAHISRRDLVGELLVAVATTLFWFWPPVRMAARALGRAREAACDRIAIERGGLAPRAYAGMLLAVASAGRARPIGLGWVRGQSELGARVDALLGGPGRGGLGRVGALALAGWALAGLGAAPSADAALALAGGESCEVDPTVVAEILANHPDADRDGDGALSRDEACAHQARMKQMILEGAVDDELVSRLDPDADRDGDGALSEHERATAIAGLAVEVEPEQVSIGRGARRLAVDERLAIATAPTAGALCESSPCLERPERTPRRPGTIVIDVRPREE
jgi:beta-lactamase regulating signal transducer with metallopeptidase domain